MIASKNFHILKRFLYAVPSLLLVVQDFSIIVLQFHEFQEQLGIDVNYMNQYSNVQQFSLYNIPDHK